MSTISLPECDREYKAEWNSMQQSSQSSERMYFSLHSNPKTIKSIDMWATKFLKLLHVKCFAPPLLNQMALSIDISAKLTQRPSEARHKLGYQASCMC